MTFTPKFDLEEIAYGTTGWNTILTANLQKIDAGIDSRLVATAGESIAQYDAAYLKISDGKFYKAKADGTKQPCRGIALETAATNETFRVHREGAVTNSGWSWGTISGDVYLSDSVAGGLTQTMPTERIEVIGYALSATTLVIERERPYTLTTTT